MMRSLLGGAAVGLPLLAAAGWGQARPGDVSALSIGVTFTVGSAVLNESRRINVYLPPAYRDGDTLQLPVLYLPDGGLGEDFLHVAGLVQVLTGNGGMRPFILVGIENTERRRDLTGPTDNPDDRRIAPRVGGSAAFRRFIRDELMPLINARYRTTGETAVVGESLAGLFVVETLVREPDLFDTYIAFDPSLWWNRGRLVSEAQQRLARRPGGPKVLYLASSAEPELARLTSRLGQVLKQGSFPGLEWHYRSMPEEQHATIYHPAALLAFRAVLGPDVKRR